MPCGQSGREIPTDVSDCRWLSEFVLFAILFCDRETGITFPNLRVVSVTFPSAVRRDAPRIDILGPYRPLDAL